MCKASATTRSVIGDVCKKQGEAWQKSLNAASQKLEELAAESGQLTRRLRAGSMWTPKANIEGQAQRVNTPMNCPAEVQRLEKGEAVRCAGKDGKAAVLASLLAFSRSACSCGNTLLDVSSKNDSTCLALLSLMQRLIHASRLLVLVAHVNALSVPPVCAQISGPVVSLCLPFGCRQKRWFTALERRLAGRCS